MVLPTSYTLLSRLPDIAPHPFTTKGPGDMYEGVLDESLVRPKGVRIHQGYGQTVLIKVCYPVTFPDRRC